MFWLLSRFFDYAVETGVIAKNARVQLEEKAKQAFALVWENTEDELRRIESRPPSLAKAIISGIHNDKLPVFMHNGCMCVRANDLTVFLQAAYERNGLSIHRVTAALRSANLLAMDASGKSTKKIRGRRYLCIPRSHLLKEANL